MTDETGEKLTELTVKVLSLFAWAEAAPPGTSREINITVGTLRDARASVHLDESWENNPKCESVHEVSTYAEGTSLAAAVELVELPKREDARELLLDDEQPHPPDCACMYPTNENG